MGGFGGSARLINLEYIGATDHLVDGTESKFCHDTAQTLGDMVEGVLVDQQTWRRAKNPECRYPQGNC